MNSMFVRSKLFNIKRISPSTLNSFIKIKTNFFANDSFGDKEKAAERIFIDKKEKELLQKLLEKLNVDDKHKPERSSFSKEEKESLGKLLKKHNKKIPDEMFDDLLHWKKGDY
jgi:hypothetical protein